jgi:hypothetical protein
MEAGMEYASRRRFLGRRGRNPWEVLRLHREICGDKGAAEENAGRGRKEAKAHG